MVVVVGRWFLGPLHQLLIYFCVIYVVEKLPKKLILCHYVNLAITGYSNKSEIYRNKKLNILYSILFRLKLI